MPVIQLEKDLLISRGESVRNLLKPISKQPEGPAWQPRFGREDYVIGAHDGSPSSSDYREWRFTAVVSRLSVMYFERWMPSTPKGWREELWHLDRAYLSLFERAAGLKLERELLCLHCDPNEPDSADHAKYKKGPHLHIVVAEYSFPHVHIGLNMGHLEAVLTCIDSLSKAMEHAVHMLREEVLDALS